MSIVVLQPGPLLTLQDRGRTAVQRWGVPISGALDQQAYTIAQRLLNNASTAAALEITAGPCRLQATETTVVALTGADVAPLLNGEPLPMWHSFLWRAGHILECQPCHSGGRAYLAFQGAIQISAQLESRSTLINGPFEGILSRPLRTGDILHLAPADLNTTGRAWPEIPHYSRHISVRYLAGPQHELFQPLQAKLVWCVQPASNRMGLRLAGTGFEALQLSLPSHGTVPGVIQVPPDGQPIILLADAQTTGGYPIWGIVITADLPLLGQLLPTMTLTFEQTSYQAAQHALELQHQWLEQPITEDSSWGAPM